MKKVSNSAGMVARLNGASLFGHVETGHVQNTIFGESDVMANAKDAKGHGSEKRGGSEPTIDGTDVSKKNLPSYPYNFGKSVNQSDHFVMSISPKKKEGGFRIDRWHRLSTDNDSRAEQWKNEKIQSIKDEMSKGGLKRTSHIITAKDTDEPVIVHTVDKEMKNSSTAGQSILNAGTTESHL